MSTTLFYILESIRVFVIYKCAIFLLQKRGFSQVNRSERYSTLLQIHFNISELKLLFCLSFLIAILSYLAAQITIDGKIIQEN